MKIIPENEIEKAALNDTKSIDRIDGFKAGVTFAESRFEELAVEFLNWYKFMDYDKDYLGYTTKELFNEFLKERNEKE